MSHSVRAVGLTLAALVGTAGAIGAVTAYSAIKSSRSEGSTARLVTTRRGYGGVRPVAVGRLESQQATAAAALTGGVR